MNIVYRGHRAHTTGTEVLNPKAKGIDPWGFLLDTGEVAWFEDSPSIYNPDPTDRQWAAAHSPEWQSLGGTRARCAVCGKLRAPLPPKP